MPYFYSASTNAFYPEDMRPAYEEAGSWPTDAKKVGDEVFSAFACDEVPAGQIRITGPGGLPAWGDIPPPSAAELESAALSKRASLLRDAATSIAPLQDAVDLGIATTEEQAALTAWKQYRVALNRIEQQAGFPQQIDWPQPPQ